MNRHLDHKYLDALREGDSKLIEALYKNHSQQVINWILNNNGSVSDAKDIFQESLIALYNKACDPDFQLTCPIGGLLFQICKNKWIDQIRKKSKDQKVRNLELKRYESEETNESLLETIEEEEIRQKKLSLSFSKLSDLCQKLLKLVSKGETTQQILNQLDMPNANTMYRRKNACIQRWKTLID